MFKKKQKQTENKEIVNRGKDYRVYTMTKTDWTIARGIGFGIGFIVSWIFFSNFVFYLPDFQVPRCCNIQFQFCPYFFPL